MNFFCHNKVVFGGLCYQVSKEFQTMPWNGSKTGISLMMKVRVLGNPCFSYNYVVSSCSDGTCLFLWL